MVLLPGSPKLKVNVPAEADPAVKARVAAAIVAPPTRDKRLIELVLIFNPLNILVAPLFVFLNFAYVPKYISKLDLLATGKIDKNLFVKRFYLIMKIAPQLQNPIYKGFQEKKPKENRDF
jgi:hypothetical protein